MDPESVGNMIRGIVCEEISAALDNKLKPIHEELEKIEVTIKSCSSKVDDLEAAANAMEGRVSTVEKQYRDLLVVNSKRRWKHWKIIAGNFICTYLGYSKG